MDEKSGRRLLAIAFAVFVAGVTFNNVLHARFDTQEYMDHDSFYVSDFIPYYDLLGEGGVKAWWREVWEIRRRYPPLIATALALYHHVVGLDAFRFQLFPVAFAVFALVVIGLLRHHPTRFPVGLAGAAAVATIPLFEDYSRKYFYHYYSWVLVIAAIVALQRFNWTARSVRRAAVQIVVVLLLVTAAWMTHQTAIATSLPVLGWLAIRIALLPLDRRTRAGLFVVPYGLFGLMALEYYSRIANYIRYYAKDYIVPATDAMPSWAESLKAMLRWHFHDASGPWAYLYAAGLLFFVLNIVTTGFRREWTTRGFTRLLVLYYFVLSVYLTISNASLPNAGIVHFILPFACLDEMDLFLAKSPWSRALARIAAFAVVLLAFATLHVHQKETLEVGLPPPFGCQQLTSREISFNTNIAHRAADRIHERFGEKNVEVAVAYRWCPTGEDGLRRCELQEVGMTRYFSDLLRFRGVRNPRDKPDAPVQIYQYPLSAEETMIGRGLDAEALKGILAHEAGLGERAPLHFGCLYHQAMLLSVR